MWRLGAFPSRLPFWPPRGLCRALGQRGLFARAAPPRGGGFCVGARAAALATVAGVSAVSLALGHQEAFSGQYCATVTEFGADGRVNLQGIDGYAKYLKVEGCVGAFVNGTSGESMSLSVDEREQLAEAWAKAGRKHGLKVIVHVGCDATPDAYRLAAHAQRLGVSGIAAMPPRFFRCKDANALADYIAGVAKEAPTTPFFYYHFPLATGAAPKPSAVLAAALSKVPTLAGMKFSDADMWEYGDACDVDAEAKLAFLLGFEACTLAFLPFHPAKDRYGSVSLSFSALAPLHQSIVDAHFAGDGAAAFEAQAALRDFFREVGPFGWTQAVKFALQRNGTLASSAMREPSAQLAAGDRARLAKVFDALADKHGKTFHRLRER
ncbi:hypothetical protein M885DRAFT_562851 [Pelagophyceae sp. CCMP2097]|nr:hypothetical protein M885DRAFT_562851 [Pelagophyceae sp. CCMP2097]